MGVGKYSPTVIGWYDRDPNWFFMNCDGDVWYDREGYDCYGYHRDGDNRDRAGNTEWNYMNSFSQYDDEITYYLTEDVQKEWWNKPFPWKAQERV
jgi:hypothetical protein